ncbi:MAG: hypothetical protein CVT90_01085, partial [Candidatus Altiarchaeales archaeon HGW-Altiarchaeales-3]
MANESVRRVVIRDEKYKKIHDEFKKIHFEKQEIESPADIDEDYFCSKLPGELKEDCGEFFKKIKEEYFKVIYEHADTPAVKYVLEELKKHKNRIGEHDNRIGILEDIYPKLKEIIDGDEFFKNRVSDLKKIIKANQKKMLADFVWKNKDDLKLESRLRKEGDVFIRGGAGIGKTYLMVKLSKIANGIYIPLERVGNSKELMLLIGNAKDKKIFLDNLQDAGKEVREYIEKSLWNVVIASRNRCDMKREFKIIELESVFDEKGIIKYLDEYNIEVEKELLNEIKDKISYPIKLRILREYMRKNKIKFLDENSFSKMPDFPEELSDWYEIYVWSDFKENEKTKTLSFILALLAEPADIGMLSVILKSKIHEIHEGAVDGSIIRMQGILNETNGRYEIFHDTFREFCTGENGRLKDARDFHETIGDYYKNLLENEDKTAEFRARFYGMYHYKNAFAKEKFMEVYSREILNLLINKCKWQDAKENLKFALKCKINEKERAEILHTLGNAQYKLNEWDDAIKCYEESMGIFKKLGDQHSYSQSIGNLGLVYSKQGRWDDAIKCYEESMGIKKKLGDQHGYSNSLTNLGLV